jgi:hypothetical protein
MREAGPRKRLDSLDIVQELDKLECACPNLLHLGRLFDRIEVVNAAARGCDDILEAGEIVHDNASVSAHSALNPLFAIGCPQQV